MVRVEPLRAEDYGRLVDWIDSPEKLLLWGGTLFTYPLTEDQLRDHYEGSQGAVGRRGFRGVEDGRTVGSLELDRIDREHHSASISRVIVDPDERGRGVASGMLREVLGLCFLELDLHRVELRVFASNEPAIACYESVGFVREGLLRDSHRHGGGYHSTVQMSMLEDEWRELDGEAAEKEG
jgi:RimJ/RimL family protein N-acetyltransferase